mgnify:CR=1 FL=1
MTLQTKISVSLSAKLQNAPDLSKVTIDTLLDLAVTLADGAGALIVFMGLGLYYRRYRKRAQGKKHNAALICLSRRRCDVLFAMLGPFPVWWTLVRFAVPDRVKGS